MKLPVLLLLLCGAFTAFAQTGPKTQHVFIITIDGLRWQEVFGGADKAIVGNREYVEDPALLRQMYWDDNKEERRKKLMPFLWNIVAGKGQLYGNRRLGNKMNVSNFYKFSYPGYCEMFTGFASRRFVPNTPVSNRNTNIFEFLNKRPRFQGKVAAFTSWNIFPYILNEKRSGFLVNSGYEALEGAEINEAKKVLANEATAMCRGREAAEQAAETARRTFEEGASGDALPTFAAAGAVPLVDALVALGFCASKGEARRLIKQGGARVGGEKVADEAATVTPGAEPIRISAGKKHHGLLVAG